MPAVTADTLTLPRSPPRPTAPSSGRWPPCHHAPSGFEGEGFPVRRAFAGVPLEALDPFIHMDQMGAVDYGPGEPRGTDWHPHRGFETVTYMLDGTFQHQDSHGGGGLITDGATQWMTAGGGILHIETPPEELVISGGLFHGLQLWVNLPAADKLTEPRYQNLEGDAGNAAVVGRRRRPACASSPATSPATPGPGSTHTPITFAHATLAPGARCTCRGGPTSTPWPTSCRARAGSGSDGRPVGDGQLVVFGAGRHLALSADERQGSRDAQPRGRGARRPADPRTARLVRPVRHEHPGRGTPGRGGLPGRPPRRRSRRWPAALPR